MKFIKPILLSFLLLIVFNSCAEKQHAEMLIFNGNIYTADPENPVVEAVAVLDNKIIRIRLIQARRSITNYR